MDVGNSARKAINDWEDGESESAMLHACNAVDGTAAKVFPAMANAARFTTVLRDSYGVLGPMCLPNIDLALTRFPVNVRNPKAPGGQPDLADVIYGIHRCCHGHGEALPDGFELTRHAGTSNGVTTFEVEQGRVRLSDRTIFGLLAVAVMSPVNADQTIPDAYHLTFANEVLAINDWWGRAADFCDRVDVKALISVKLDFGDWMTS